MSVSACGIDNRPAGERSGNIPNALRARHSLRIEEEEIYANGKQRTGTNRHQKVFQGTKHRAFL